MLRISSVVTAVAVLAFAPATANAQIKERTLKLNFGNVLDHPVGKGIAKLSEIVAEKSGKKITIRAFPSAQLGGDIPTISAMQGGTIEMSIMNSGLLVGIDKRFAALDFPFMFANAEQSDFVVDGPVGTKLHAALNEKGLVGLGYWELGFRNVTNSKRPIAKLEDFQGLKLRVLQSPLFIETFNALGANAVPMAWPEVYPALEQKVVDGQENPFPTIRGAKLNEVQKFVSSSNHIYNAQSVLISKKIWDDLSAEEKKILQDAVKEATAFQRKTSREAMAGALEDLKKGGMTHNEISDAEMARIRDKVKPVIEKFAKDVGPELIAEMQAEIAKAPKK